MVLMGVDDSTHSRRCLAVGSRLALFKFSKCTQRLKCVCAVLILFAIVGEGWALQKVSVLEVGSKWQEVFVKYFKEVWEWTTRSCRSWWWVSWTMILKCSKRTVVTQQLICSTFTWVTGVFPSKMCELFVADVRLGTGIAMARCGHSFPL